MVAEAIKKNIYLASTSPRRVSILKELLEPFHLSFKSVSPTFKEVINGYPPKELVAVNAKGKVTTLQSEIDNGSLLIGADTVVCIGNDIIGKPENKNEARESLKKLSGRRHSVFTGVAVLDTASQKLFEGCEETIVTFHELTDEDIESYVSTSEPLDKAGAYGIQGLGKIFVKKIDGGFSNVVGLPKKLTLSLLKQAGLRIYLRQSVKSA